MNIIKLIIDCNGFGGRRKRKAINGVKRLPVIFLPCSPVILNVPQQMRSKEGPLFWYGIYSHLNQQSRVNQQHCRSNWKRSLARRRVPVSDRI